MLGLKNKPCIDELVFMDDFLRGSENGMKYSGHNRRFLRRFFGTAASRLGWKTRELGSQSQDGCIPVADIMKAYDLPLSPAGWAAACVADFNKAAEHFAFLDLPSSALVIGWGLTPATMHYLNSRGISFIDVEIGSIRFARDLHLVMRTNDQGIRREIEKMRIHEDHFWSAAAGMRSYFGRRGQPSIVSPDISVGLFVGQMSIDLAMVRNGRLAKPADFVDEVRQWSKEVDLLAIRSHPAQPDPDHLYVLLEAIPNAVLLNSNTYSLLCADNLAFVGAISSGTLKEAAYLGCNDIRRLMQDDRNNPQCLPDGCSPWVAVELDVASTTALMNFSRARSRFWHWPLPRPGRSRKSPFAEDMLNHIFGYRWGMEPTASGLPELPVLSPGSRMDFTVGAPGSACAIFGRGWLWPESWGVWSAEPHASLVIPIKLPDETCSVSEFAFTLVGHAYVPEKAIPPKIIIFANGIECDCISENNGEMHWTARFSSESVRSRMLVISIHVQGALRQCDLGGEANDFRAFGLGLRYVMLDEIGATDTDCG